MASGLPVATTPDNGVADLIESERNGLVLAGDFAPAFARLDDRIWLERAGLEARRSAEARTWSRHADEVLALYARVRR
jgi:glycosyltransferase involved in cell wall biosynthesis